MRKLVKRPLLCGLLVLLGACSQDQPEASDETLTRFTQQASFEIEISGHKTAAYRATTSLLVMNAPLGAGKRVLVAGPNGAVDLGDNTSLEVFAQVGPFEGDGTYEAKPSGPKASLESNVYAQWVRRPPTGTPEVHRFDIMNKGCTITIDDDGSSGSARCEGLASQFEGEVAIDVKWTGTGPRIEDAPPASDAGTSTSSSAPPS